MEFRILGPLEAANSGNAVPLGGPRHRVLLAALLVHAGDVVSRDRLIDVLWVSGPPRRATEMLQVRISELRKFLRTPAQADLVVTEPAGYAIQVGPEDLDVFRFERLVAEGRQALAAGDSLEAEESLRKALAQWRGAALPEIADRSFAQPEIARLEELRLRAIEDRISAEIALGRHGEVTAELRALVDRYPLRERFWHQLMLVLYRQGRQGDALNTYHAATELLAEELGIDPGVELQRLHAAILQQDPQLGLPADTPNNLPVHLTSFIGRETEIAEIREWLRTARLLTLTGPGGSGKSRLAAELASTLTEAFPGGIWLVELAPLADPRLIAQAVAGLLGIREHPERDLIDQLIAHLRPTAALLLLDNCEHLLDGVADFVRRLLYGCPRLHVLCTSRERLHITEEVLRPVPGLRVPEQRSASAGQIRCSDAVRLFAERAAAARAGFVVSGATAGSVAEICQRLDGMPLAIELAAARINTYSADQVAARLGDRFQLLSGGTRAALPRHRTLRAVVDWSYELLGEAERRTFDQLSVFVGCFTFAAAEAVCRPTDRAEDFTELLARLVDKSLVVAEADARTEYRYRLLETLREYGAARLDERGETTEARSRHSAYFLAIAEEASEGLRTDAQPSWLQRLSSDHGNLRAALEWSLRGDDAETAARMASCLYPYWDLHGHYTEGRRWLRRVLAPGRTISPGTRIRAFMGAATLAVIQGDLVQATTACDEAVRLSREADDDAGLAHALQYLGLIAIYAGELDRAAELLDASLHSAQRAEAPWEHGWALLFQSLLALTRHDDALAKEISDRAAATIDVVGDPEAIAWILVIRSAAAWRQNDLDEAAQAVSDALRAFRHLSGVWGLSVALLVAACVLGSSGHNQVSARMIGASESLRGLAGVDTAPVADEWLVDVTGAATAELGSEAFQREWQTGHNLPRDVAVTSALQLLQKRRTT